MAVARRTRGKSKVQNLDKMMARLDAMPESVEREVLLELARAAVEVRDGARHRVPKKTRRLHDSIWVRRRGKKFRVGSMLVYAPVIEFGSRKKPAQPFLYPAFKEVALKLRPKLIAAVNRGGKAVAR